MMMLSRAQMVALAQPCVNAVRTAVDKGDARLAFAVGKSIGVFAPPKLGPDEPGEVWRWGGGLGRRRQKKLKSGEGGEGGDGGVPGEKGWNCADDLRDR